MKEPDRVPMDYWADDTITKNLISHLGLKNKEDLLKAFGIDFRYIEGTVMIDIEKPDRDGVWTDIWGVKRKKVKSGKSYYENVIEYPLANASTVRDIEKYDSWPSPDIYDYSRVENMASAHGGYCVICGGDRLNRTAQLKPAMYLRGIEQIMFDLATDEKLVCAINERLVDFFLEYNRRIFENANKKIDIFFMGDDFGTQMGLMMNIEMW
jgi:uroporphyrinogen decarboxylase